MIPSRLIPMLLRDDVALFLAGTGVADSEWTDPTCTITTGITMASNSISTDVTMTTSSVASDVTMSANSMSSDVGMGCGNQGA
jgi:hypothetical protein